MGTADYLDVGNWNILCDRCGHKMKGSEAVRTWQGYYVHQKCWEPRHPQDFVKSVQENPVPPFVRNPADIFVGVDYIIPEGTSFWSPGEDTIDVILTETGQPFITEG